MPDCRNCGAHVTPDYARVFTPTGVDEPRCCPDCPDLVRDNGTVREARASRGTTVEPTPANPETGGGAE